MKKEQRWELRYVNSNGEERVCTPRSMEQKEENIRKCFRLGYKVLSCRKLYPFSTNKNQHNFELISNVCYNTMHDMDMGEIPYDGEEYDRLSDMKDKADRFFCYELPVAWVTWEEHCEMKELANMAILHRQDACIRNGRPDLVTYC